jgi:hypothetical protein
MKLYIWNLDVDGTVNRVIAFASDEQEAWETVANELNIDLNRVDRPEPEVYENRVFVAEYTNIGSHKERVEESHRDCEVCGNVIQEEGGEGENGLLCRDCAEQGDPDGVVDDSMDGDHGSALASAGWGTDEDYGCFGGDDF